MNILQVHHNWDEDEPGGIVAMMVDLMDGLAAQGHQVSLLVNDWQADTPKPQVDRTGRPYHRLNLAPLPASLGAVKAMIGWLWRLPLAVWRLRRFCREQGIEVAQLHYADALYLVFAVLRLVGGPPYVVTVHRGDVMGYPEQPRLRRWAYQRVMAGASAVVAVSRALGEQAVALSPQIRRLEVIHNGYTPPFASLLSHAELERMLGRTLPERFATLVGNCRPYKGQDIALEAWAKLTAEGVALPLILVGGGPDLAAMRALCTARGLDELVVFTGPVSRQAAASLTALATVQVAPSRNEGQGIVILEAGHAGTPVICSDIPPFLEMVVSGQTATVFPNEDAAKLAAAVRRLLEDPAPFTAAAARLREHVRTAFSSASMVAKYAQLFAAVSRAPERS